jgi:hypothetical protein
MATGGWNDIEREALLAPLDNYPDSATIARIEMSKAISAKRQADALERIADALESKSAEKPEGASECRACDGLGYCGSCGGTGWIEE